MILLGFAKVTDKVPHQGLLYELHYYGVRENTLLCIQAFLDQRNQQILLEGCRSSQADIISGVQQGTVLGLLLFLAYINDVPEIVRSSNARLFADECLLYEQIKNEKDVALLQKDLAALEDWEQNWQMKFLTEKCTVLHIDTNRRNTKEYNYTLHDHTLEAVESGKYLAVTLTNNLSWKNHVQQLISSQSLNLGGRRGTTDDVAIIFFHPSLSSAALRESQSPIPVHSFMLSSHLFFCLPLLLAPFTAPSRIVFAMPEDLEMWPYPLSFHFLTMVRSSCTPFAFWILLRTSTFFTWPL